MAYLSRLSRDLIATFESGIDSGRLPGIRFLRCVGGARIVSLLAVLSLVSSSAFAAGSKDADSDATSQQTDNTLTDAPDDENDEVAEKQSKAWLFLSDHFVRPEPDHDTSCNDFLQDRQGVIWVGASNGVVRYTSGGGNRVLADPWSLSSRDSAIHSIVQSPKSDQIWMISASALFRFDESEPMLKRVHLFKNTATPAALEHHRGRSVVSPRNFHYINATLGGDLLIGVDGGLLRLRISSDHQVDSVRLIRRVRQGPGRHATDQAEWSNSPDEVATETSSSDPGRQFAMIDRNNQDLLWVRSDAGLSSFNSVSNRWTNHVNHRLQVNGQTGESKSTVQPELADKSGRLPSRIREGRRIGRRYLIDQSLDGRIWMTRHGRLVAYDPSTDSVSSIRLPVPRGSVCRSMAINQADDAVWMAFSGMPLPCVFDQSAKRLTTFRGDGKRPPAFLAFDRTNALWTQITNRRIGVYDVNSGHQQSYTHQRLRDNGRVIGVLPGVAEKTAWVFQRPQVTRLDSDGRSFAIRDYDSLPASNPILDFEATEDGFQVLLQNGIKRYQHGGDWTDGYQFDQPLQESDARFITRGESVIYVAAGDRIRRYDTDSNEPPESVTVPDRVTCLAIFQTDDSEPDRLWVGLRNGIGFLSLGGDVDFTLVEGFESPVNAIAADQSGQIWAATDQGLIRIDELGRNPIVVPTKVNRRVGGLTFDQTSKKAYLIVDGDVRCYDVESDQLLSLNPHLASDALDLNPWNVRMLSNGLMLIAGYDNAILFDTQQITANESGEPPVLSILGISVESEADQDTDLPSKIERNDNHRYRITDRLARPSLHVMLDDFRAVSKMRFRYRINGGEWLSVAGSNRLPLLDLSVGKNAVQIDGWSGRGVSAANRVTAIVCVDGPVYLQAGFLKTAVFVGVLGVVLLAVGRHKATQRHAAQLARSEAKFREIVESSSDTMLSVNRAGVIIEANPAAARLFDAESQKQLVGTTLSDFVSEPDSELLMTTLLSEQSQSRKIDLLSHSGATKHALCQVSKSQHDSNVIRVQMTDMTRTIELENAVQHSERMRMVGTLAGAVAHDFNNLLTPIMLATETALRATDRGATIDHADVRPNLELTLEAAKHGSDLVNQVIGFTRDHGDVEVELVDVDSSLAEAIKVLRKVVPKNVVINFESSASSKAVHCTPANLHQIVVNLGMNAYQAIGTDPGTITIAANGEFRDDDSSWVEISVTDTGCGIDASIADQIFDPFFSGQGIGLATGLGLSVVDKIVRSLAGTVHFDSSVGQGTRFVVRLPSQKNQPKNTAGKPIKAAIDPSDVDSL